MNLLDLSEMLKGAPDDYLRQHVQTPDGTVPQFLALSELQRRQDMRARFAGAAQAKEPSTVAQDILQQGGSPGIGGGAAGGDALNSVPGSPGLGLGGISPGPVRSYARGGDVEGDRYQSSRDKYNGYDPEQIMLNMYKSEGRSKRSLWANERGDYTAKNPHSSAYGAGQFIDETWANFAKRAGVDINDRSPEAQDKVMRTYMDYNRDVLARNGLDITPSNLYALHFLGEGRGADFLKTLDRNPSAKIADVIPAKVRKINPAIFDELDGDVPVTLADMKARLVKKMGHSDRTTTRGLGRNIDTAADPARYDMTRSIGGDMLKYAYDGPTERVNNRSIWENLANDVFGVRSAYGAEREPSGIAAGTEGYRAPTLLEEIANYGRNIRGFEAGGIVTKNGIKYVEQADGTLREASAPVTRDMITDGPRKLSRPMPVDPAIPVSEMLSGYRNMMSKSEAGDADPYIIPLRRQSRGDADPYIIPLTDAPSNQEFDWSAWWDRFTTKPMHLWSSGGGGSAAPGAAKVAPGETITNPGTLAIALARHNAPKVMDWAKGMYDQVTDSAQQYVDTLKAPPTEETMTHADTAAENLAKIYDQMAADKKEARDMALLNAGFAMMAGESPWAGVNIGKGGMAGVQTYNDMMKQSAGIADSKARLALAQQEYELNRRGQNFREEMGREQLAVSKARAMTYAAKMSGAGKLSGAKVDDFVRIFERLHAQAALTGKIDDNEIAAKALAITLNAGTRLGGAVGGVEDDGINVVGSGAEE